MMLEAWDSIFFEEETIGMRIHTTGVAFGACMLAIYAVAMPASAHNCHQKRFQSRPIDLGVSGGNINAFQTIGGRQFCFDGTLGSMVQDGDGNKFILSNNHVLADINSAAPGELIVQPGLAEKAIRCNQVPGDAIATFSRDVTVVFGGSDNTIDAAIAAVDTGDVNPEILNIGSIASTIATPAPGMRVEKMGRTTCLTSGKIAAVAVQVIVDYGSGRVANFINQILINGHFGGPGDSGSLIVTKEACPQAVALLFAGSRNQKHTFANPISDVLSGLNVSMVGGCSAAAVESPDPVEAGNAEIPKDAVNSTKAVRDRHHDELMRIPGAVGTGIGVGDQPGQTAIEVYLKKLTPEAQAAAPKTVEGVPVRLIETGGVVAY